VVDGEPITGQRTENRRPILNHKDTKDTKKIHYIEAETKKVET